jgi:hypothetical protein
MAFAGEQEQTLLDDDSPLVALEGSSSTSDENADDPDPSHPAEIDDSPSDGWENGVSNLRETHGPPEQVTRLPHPVLEVKLAMKPPLWP